MATTMQDIARLAGVSRVAVSYALNGRPGVSAEVRERILSIAREMGFSPNASAKALRGAAANAVGLVLPRPSSSAGFHQELISGMQIALAARGFGLVLQFAPSAREELAIYRRWHAERRIDGIVVCDPRVDDARIPALRRLGLPTVVIGGRGDYAGLANLWSDEAAAAVKAAGYLHALGHRRVAHELGPAGTLQTAWRTEAFAAACQSLGLTLARSPFPIAPLASTGAGNPPPAPPPAPQATHRRPGNASDASDAPSGGAARSTAADAASLAAPPRLSQGPGGGPSAAAGLVVPGAGHAGHAAGDWPTAIVYDNDLMAIAGLRAAVERGLSVPSDLSIVSWDDSALCQAVRPALSVLRRNLTDMGVAATRLLLEWIDGQPPRSVQHDNATFVVRGSTTSPR